MQKRLKKRLEQLAIQGEGHIKFLSSCGCVRNAALSQYPDTKMSTKPTIPQKLSFPSARPRTTTQSLCTCVGFDS